MKKRFFLVILVIILIPLLTGCFKKPAFVNVNVKSDSGAQNTSTDSLVVGGKSTSTPVSAVPTSTAVLPKDTASSSQAQIIKIPARFDMDVAFASQAPFVNWDALHEEACEEASMIIVAKYFKHEPLDNQIMETGIQDLVKWETDNGYKIDLDAQETVDILKTYFGVKAHLETEVTIDKIKYELSLGHLIIVPTAGRLLGNPYFTGLGPIYHMFVIRGYDGANFITNDVGIKRGKGYTYKQKTILNSIHDWNHDLAADGMTAEEIKTGQKVMIVVDGI